MTSDVPEKFTAEYYDQDYFKTPKGKKFKRSNGSIDAWSYANPNGEVLAFRSITEAWNTIFQPKNMLDVGCGRGTVVAYSRDLGIEAFGFDYSQWAVSDEGRYPRCKREWLAVHDATKPWTYPTHGFDLLIALDFLEHIYLDDLDFVIEEMYRVAKKHIFLQIATVDGLKEKGYTLKKNEPIPVELEGYAVAGHTTVCTEAWWYEKLEHEEWLPRRDMVNWFTSLVEPDNIRNWLLNTMIILERVT